MRRATTIALVAMMTLLVMTPVASAKGTADNHFVAQLRGANEVPPVTTKAHGTAHLRVSRDRTRVSFKVIVNKPSSPVTAAHIHKAPAGVNGPVVVDLLGSATKVRVNRNTTVFSGVFQVSAWLGFSLADTAAGLHYINVHNASYPAGEVRGQLD